MEMKSSKRSCISGLVTASFVLVGVTGVLMLLHVRDRAITTLHEWMGLLFVVAGVIHLILNWKAFAKYCKQLPVIITLVIAAILGTALLLAGSGENHGSPDHHRLRIERQISRMTNKPPQMPAATPRPILPGSERPTSHSNGLSLIK